ncbi:MAG: hypothetical protein MJ100_09060 [Ruminococcus sp.]|nr:hypothetical protein [Ruminococcus sp.]
MPKKNKNVTEENETPIWLVDNGKIDEPLFCEWFAEKYALMYTNGFFYNLRGELKLSTITYKPQC